MKICTSENYTHVFNVQEVKNGIAKDDSKYENYRELRKKG